MRAAAAGLLVALAVLAPACAGAPKTVWHKPGATPQETEAAREACIAEANERYIPPEEVLSPAPPGEHAPLAERELAVFTRRHQLFERCMEEKGYARVPAEAARTRP